MKRGYIDQRLAELHVDLSDYSDEFVEGFVQGANTQRDFDPSLWTEPSCPTCGAMHSWARRYVGSDGSAWSGRMPDTELCTDPFHGEVTPLAAT